MRPAAAIVLVLVLVGWLLFQAWHIAAWAGIVILIVLFVVSLPFL